MVRPAECAGSLGGIIGGYKDAKIAGETRTRALGIPDWYLARRPWWGGGSLRAFRRAEVIFVQGSNGCELRKHLKHRKGWTGPLASLYRKSDTLLGRWSGFVWREL